MIRTKRVYLPRESRDGVRILVMRFWPRGVRRDRVDEWNRALAPSRELLRAFKHEGLAFGEFARRYLKELSPGVLEELRERARRETLTLLCGCPDEHRCHREILRRALREPPEARGRGAERRPRRARPRS